MTRPEVTTRDDGTTLAFLHDDRVLADYVYRSDDVQLESPRPYLHPMYTLGGQLVTLRRPHDHVWHKGIAWSLPHVGPHNFWGGPTFVRDHGYRQLANNGAMVHEGFTDTTDGRASHDLRWETQDDHEVVVREHRVLTARLVDERAWALDFRTELVNTSGTDLPLGSPTTHGRDNAGYGGLFWRGPRAWTNGTLLAPGATGGDELRGRRGAWMGFTGRHDDSDAASTIVIVDGGDNPGGVPQWFARSEEFAALCPAPFFSSEVAFPPEARVAFAYTVIVADGRSDPDRAAALVAAAGTTR